MAIMYNLLMKFGQGKLIFKLATWDGSLKSFSIIVLIIFMPHLQLYHTIVRARGWQLMLLLAWVTKWLILNLFLKELLLFV